jgi:hypothetical protein
MFSPVTCAPNRYVFLNPPLGCLCHTAGGYYVKNAPVWIQWVQYLSYVHWGWNLQLQVQFGSLAAADCSPSIAADVSALSSARGDTPSATGGPPAVAAEASCTELLQASGIFPSTDLLGSPANNVGVLLGFIVGLRVITYYCLRYTSSFRPPKR